MIENLTSNAKATGNNQVTFNHTSKLNNWMHDTMTSIHGVHAVSQINKEHRI